MQPHTCASHGEEAHIAPAQHVRVGVGRGAQTDDISRMNEFPDTSEKTRPPRSTGKNGLRAAGEGAALVGTKGNDSLVGCRSGVFYF